MAGDIRSRLAHSRGGTRRRASAVARSAPERHRPARTDYDGRSRPLVAPSSAGEIVGYRAAIRERLGSWPSRPSRVRRAARRAMAGRVKPVRHARRQRRDDHLVERLAVECLAHRDERVGVADEAFDMPARRLLEQRDGGLLPLRVPVGTRYEQYETGIARGPRGCARRPRARACPPCGTPRSGCVSWWRTPCRPPHSVPVPHSCRTPWAGVALVGDRG
jgi:hypothetical protein